MKPTMRVTVMPKKSSNETLYEGLVQMPNLSVTKLRKEGGGTNYSTVVNLRQAATMAARKYNANLVFVGPKSVAAKKSSN
jgi:hypothetical protein